MNAESLLHYISQHIHLTGEEIDILLSLTKYRKYLKGQFVVQQGDVCQYESFVLSGCLKTFYIDKEGQEHVVMFSVEDWWASDLGSFLTHTPADYNVQCLENTELFQFPYDKMELLYAKIPKLERFFRIILQKAFVASQKRIVQNFSLTAKERYLQFKQQYPQIEQRVPQYLIASYLGITKEFLSKIRNQLILEQ
ncbi:Crp/Fnr family transcriptional regulator [Rapidithrix thailandica]|uniref:Crp/Fnr family transcriptional regulator n=1 Tax=Rapidithrix thailandica TaxID=413964 RepID=A0AAW9SD89_9BACT